MDLPYSEKQIDNQIYLRTFDSETPHKDLLWHKDAEDRIVKATHETNWKFQFDNQLPQNLNEEIFIPKLTYHRLIKGDGDLEIKVEKRINI